MSHPDIGKPNPDIEKLLENEHSVDVEKMRRRAARNGHTKPTVEEEFAAVPWPDPLAPDAFHGLAGEWCEIVKPHSEADVPAHLIQFLLGFGNLIGGGPYFRVAGTKHHTNIFVVLVGATGKSRKGTSWGQDRLILSATDSDWAEKREMSGLSTGEGLINVVRDPRPVQASENNGNGHKKRDPEEEQDRAGVDDKRALVVESEFGRVLKVSEREQSTLSAVIRDAWDSRPLAVMTRKDAPRSTGAHISILGHITTHELRKRLTEEAIANGFANRFLYVCTRRVAYLPDGGELHRVNLQPYLTRIQLAAEFAKSADELRRDEPTIELWNSVYKRLSQGQSGLLGSITARAEAHVVRLACLYAVLDRSHLIRIEHLSAALAVWQYCEQSAQYIFGTATGDPIADEILQVIRSAQAGATQTDLYNHFGRNRKATDITVCLKRLADLGLIHSTRETSGPTGGRPATRWFGI